MKSNELRIGNYTLLEMAHNPDSFHIITANDIFELNSDPQDDFYQPIPITEHWLIKLGFKQGIDKNYWYNTKICFDSFGEDGYYLTDERTGKESIKIKYVHQFQNLYFALIGEELITNN